jgi:hypothetical protein
MDLIGGAFLPQADECKTPTARRKELMVELFELLNS